MPIQQSMWKIGDEVKELSTITLPSEDELEEILQIRVEMLNPNWLVIGRQVLTAFNHYIDLLAINSNGSLIVIELKKGKTPRDVVAQALDYASWVVDLEPDAIAKIYRKFSDEYMEDKDRSFDDAFHSKFGINPDEDELNSSHQIVVVASEFDASTERIVSYLADAGVAINLALLKVFSDEGNRYLSRAWFMDPDITEDTAAFGRDKEPWNGEFYVSLGEGERNWDDARKYGFISAGGGLWYTRTLNQLSVGDRVWVNIPQTGYVGVGRVLEPARKADEMTFEVNGAEKNIYELSDRATYYEQYIDDDDMAEYMVKVKWRKTVGRNQAVKETGFFGNQNTVCKPTSPKWNHTIDTLKRKWGIDD